MDLMCNISKDDVYEIFIGDDSDGITDNLGVACLFF